VHTQKQKEHILLGIDLYEQHRRSYPLSLSAVIKASTVTDLTLEFLRDFEKASTSPTGGLYHLGQYVGKGSFWSILLELSCSKAKNSKCRTHHHAQIPSDQLAFIFNFGGLFTRFFLERYTKKVGGVCMTDMAPSVFTLEDPDDMLDEGSYAYTWTAETMCIRAAIKTVDSFVLQAKLKKIEVGHSETFCIAAGQGVDSAEFGRMIAQIFAAWETEAVACGFSNQIF